MEMVHICRLNIPSHVADALAAIRAHVVTPVAMLMSEKCIMFIVEGSGYQASICLYTEVFFKCYEYKELHHCKIEFKLETLMQILRVAASLGHDVLIEMTYFIPKNCLILQSMWFSRLNVYAEVDTRMTRTGADIDIKTIKQGTVCKFEDKDSQASFLIKTTALEETISRLNGSDDSTVQIHFRPDPDGSIKFKAEEQNEVNIGFQ